LLNLTSCMVKVFQNRRDLRSSCWVWNHQKQDLGLLWWNQIRSRDAVKSLIKDNPELADELEVKIKARIKGWTLKILYKIIKYLNILFGHFFF
jgi:hypothetical protein